MSGIYGCIVCGMERPKELDWNWLSRHRGLVCPDARWGLIREEGDRG